MKQAADHYTVDMLDKPRRGRPKKVNALTPAQRARAYRQRKKEGSNFRDASRKLEQVAFDPDGWYFPGSPEWQAQRAAQA